MPRRKKWSPQLDGTGSLADAVATFEDALPAVEAHWNVHCDRYLRYAACCHAMLGQPDRATALLERVRMSGERLTGWGELAAFLARAGLTGPARQCAERAEAALTTTPPHDSSTTYRYAPLAAAWKLLGNEARAAELFVLAEEGLEDRHNHSSKVRALIRAWLTTGDTTEGARILDAQTWESHSSGHYLDAVFHHDVDAGLALLRGAARKCGRFSHLQRVLSVYTAAGRYADAWDAFALFDNLYRQPRQLALLQEMFAVGKRDEALARIEEKIAALSEWPKSIPPWLELLAEHAPERVDAHEPQVAAGLEQAAGRYNTEDFFHPLARIRIRQGRLAEALDLVPLQRDDRSRLALLRVVCEAVHAHGEPTEAPLSRLTALPEATIEASAPRQRLDVSLGLLKTFHAMGDAETRQRALDEAHTHAASCPSKDKRFRYESIMLTCRDLGLPLDAYAALQRMPAGSRKYEVLDLAGHWVGAGHIKDAIELVLRIPTRGEGPFRTFERIFRLLQVTCETTHPGIAPLMPD